MSPSVVKTYWKIDFLSTAPPPTVMDWDNDFTFQSPGISPALWGHAEGNSPALTRVVNLGTTTKLCSRNFVPKPYPRHVVVVSRPKIG